MLAHPGACGKHTDKQIAHSDTSKQTDNDRAEQKQEEMAVHGASNLKGATLIAEKGTTLNSKQCPAVYWLQ